MSAKSNIEWTRGDDGTPGATWNPTVGCTKVSAGCDHCYAETLVNRFAGSNKGFPNRFDVMTLRGEDHLTLPLRWRKPKRVFVNSLSDLFHADVPDEFIARVFAVMAMAPQHTFQLLTKRHARMRALLLSTPFRRLVGEAGRGIAFDRVAGKYPSAGPMLLTEDSSAGGYWEPVWPLPNVWLGVSVENQQWADIRIPALLDTPAAVRFLSCEPLLGPVDLSKATDAYDAVDGVYWKYPWLSRIGWVIGGGESGPGARPMHTDWAESLRDLALADQLATYLATRQHTLSTARLTGMDQLFAEAEYVVKEALELRDAVIELAEADRRGEATEEHWRHVRHEIADAVLAPTTLAGMLPGGVTVEACIAEKTEADRGRG